MKTQLMSVVALWFSLACTTVIWAADPCDLAVGSAVYAERQEYGDSYDEYMQSYGDGASTATDYPAYNTEQQETTDGYEDGSQDYAVGTDLTGAVAMAAEGGAVGANADEFIVAPPILPAQQKKREEANNARLNAQYNVEMARCLCTFALLSRAEAIQTYAQAHAAGAPHLPSDDEDVPCLYPGTLWENLGDSELATGLELFLDNYDVYEDAGESYAAGEADWQAGQFAAACAHYDEAIPLYQEAAFFCVCSLMKPSLENARRAYSEATAIYYACYLYFRMTA